MTTTSMIRAEQRSASMSRHFWLNDEQWAAIEPLLPQVHTGPERQDDRRIISGILHRLREGCTWRAVPEVYGPYTTVYNRYNRWSQRGLWQGIFAALVGCKEPPTVTMIDSTAVKAHRSSAGARQSPQKGGSRPKRSVARAAAGQPRSTPSSTTSQAACNYLRLPSLPKSSSATRPMTLIICAASCTRVARWR